MKGVINRSATFVATIAFAAASPANGQRVLDLPLRAAAGADALATGPIAVFWNPASLGLPAARGEVLLMDVNGPSSTGLDGVGLAAVVRLDDRTAVALGFQHVGVGDIDETTTSPLPGDGATPLDVSENAFNAAAVRRVGRSIDAGASVRYTRASDVVGGDDVLAIGAGGRWAGVSAFAPTVAGAIRLDEEGLEWFTGGGVSRRFGGADEWRAGAEYGIAGSPRFHGVTHRLAATGTWRDRLRASAGLAGEPGADGHTWNPSIGAGLQVSRYHVSYLRETLANGIGSVNSFRLNIAF